MNSEEEIKLPEIPIQNEKEEILKIETSHSASQVMDQVDEIFNLENITINNKVIEQFQQGEEIESNNQIQMQESTEEIKKHESIEERKKPFLKKQGNSLKNIHEISQALQKVKTKSSTDLSYNAFYSPPHKKKVDSEIFTSLSNNKLDNLEKNNAFQEKKEFKGNENYTSTHKPDIEKNEIEQKEKQDIRPPPKKIKKSKYKKKTHIKTPLSDIFEHPMEEREDFKINKIEEELTSKSPLNDSFRKKLEFNQILFFTYAILLYSTNMILTLIEMLRSKNSLCEDYFPFFNFMITIVIKVICLNLLYLEIKNENLVETFFPFEASILVFLISPSLQLVQFTFDFATDEFINPLFSINFVCNVNKAFGIIIIFLAGLSLITLCFTSKFERNNRLGRLENFFFKNSLLCLVIFMGSLNFLLQLSQIKYFFPALFMESFGLFFFLGIGVYSKLRKNNKIEDEKLLIGKLPPIIAKEISSYDITNSGTNYRKVKADSNRDGGSSLKVKEDI